MIHFILDDREHITTTEKKRKSGDVDSVESSQDSKTSSEAEEKSKEATQKQDDNNGSEDKTDVDKGEADDAVEKCGKDSFEKGDTKTDDVEKKAEKARQVPNEEGKDDTKTKKVQKAQQVTDKERKDDKREDLPLKDKKPLSGGSTKKQSGEDTIRVEHEEVAKTCKSSVSDEVMDEKEDETKKDEKVEDDVKHVRGERREETSSIKKQGEKDGGKSGAEDDGRKDSPGDKIEKGKLVRKVEDAVASSKETDDAMPCASKRVLAKDDPDNDVSKSTKSKDQSTTQQDPSKKTSTQRAKDDADDDVSKSSKSKEQIDDKSSTEQDPSRDASAQSPDGSGKRTSVIQFTGTTAEKEDEKRNVGKKEETSSAGKTKDVSQDAVEADPGCSAQDEGQDAQGRRSKSPEMENVGKEKVTKDEEDGGDDEIVKDAVVKKDVAKEAGVKEAVVKETGVKETVVKEAVSKEEVTTDEDGRSCKDDIVDGSGGPGMHHLFVHAYCSAALVVLHGSLVILDRWMVARG